MSDHIKIHPAEGTWVVRAGGAVIAESTAALELIDGDTGPVIYFPQADIAMAFLDATDKTSHSPQLGDAQYFSIVTKSTTLPNAAWSYVTPNAAVARIKDHIAFYPMPEKVTVEQV